MLDLTRAYGLNFLVPAGDTAVGWCLRLYGEFARPELDLLSDYMTHLGAPGTFIDVGANVGAICLPLAQRHPDWRVIAVEAHRGLSGVLAANALNNQLVNLDWHHAAAGAAAGLTEFPALSLGSRTNFGNLGAHMNADTPTEQVRVVALDDLAPSDTRLVKVDVEGAELEVLRGATRLLRDIKPVWLLEAKREDQPSVRAVADMLRDAGYSLYLSFAPFVTQSHPKATGLKAGPAGDFNLLALPPNAPNLWSLPEIGGSLDAWPRAASAFPYLERYGYTPQ